MTRKYYLEHRVEILRKAAERYRSNRKKKCENVRRHYRKNRAKILRYKSEHYLEHRSKLAPKNAEWKRNNRERVNELARAAYQKHPEKRLRQCRKYYQANREKRDASIKRWKATSKGRASLQRSSACRRAKRMGARGDFTTADIILLLVCQGEKCALCKKPFPLKGTWHRFDIDHILPLSKGGSNGPENIQLLCHRCNMKKQAQA